MTFIKVFSTFMVFYRMTEFSSNAAIQENKGQKC